MRLSPSRFLEAGQRASAGSISAKRHILRLAAGLLLPLLEEAAVAEDGHVGRLYMERREHAINPLSRTFEFGVLADGRLVNDAMTGSVGPFAAPFS